jgi:hypothetical protein
MTQKVTNQKWREGRQVKYDKTVKTIIIIHAQGYKVVEKWECIQQFDVGIIIVTSCASVILINGL